MNEAKIVDVEKVINGLKWCSETAKEKGCVGCPYCYQVEGDVRCHTRCKLKKLIAESLEVITQLQTQIRVMQESYDDAVAEQAKLSETNTAMKIYEKAVEYYDEPTSLVVSYHKMMDWVKENYCLEKVKVNDECKVL